MKGEHIQTSPQSNQIDSSKITSNPSKTTKVPTGDKSQHETTKAKASLTQETKPSSPSPDKREDLTALKALDVLLRRYDRRSTPTNDLGKKSSRIKFSQIQCLLKLFDGHFRKWLTDLKVQNLKFEVLWNKTFSIKSFGNVIED